MRSPDPFPNIIVPGISPGVQYCIFRVNRTFDGVFEGLQGASAYTCGTGPAARKTHNFPSAMTWRITAALECGESVSVLPASQLTAKGTTITHEDGFAHFMGEFSMVKTEQGQPDVTYFQGIMVLIGRNGSHQMLGEVCDEEEHIEGWLIGREPGPMSKYILQVVIVAKGKLSEGVIAFPDPSANRITGTIMSGGHAA
jgi:hypothetical protein